MAASEKSEKSLLPFVHPQRMVLMPKAVQTLSPTALVLRSLVVLLALWVFDYCFHNPFCNAMYRCGCTWNWAGGWDKCNVHNPTGPRCPWCAAKPTVVWLVLDKTVITIAFLVYIYVSAKHQHTGSLQFLAPFLAWTGYNFFMGVVFYVFSDYPWFLWWSKSA